MPPFNLNKEIQLINSMIKSVTDLIAIFRINSQTNDLITDVMSLIFKLLRKIFILLPVIHLHISESKNPKLDLTNKYQLVVDFWNENQNFSLEFNFLWIDFVASWSKYNIAIYEVTASENKIYLSLN